MQTVNKVIYVVSDSTGETAERVIRAALSQFYDEDVRIHRLCQIHNQADVLQAMTVAVNEPGMVAYTLVDPATGRRPSSGWPRNTGCLRWTC